MLAETVSVDGGTLLLILAALLVAVLIVVATVTFGFILAPRAGRGERPPLGWWVAIVSLEGLYALACLATLFTDARALGAFVPAVIVAAQVSSFLRTRRDAAR